MSLFLLADLALSVIFFAIYLALAFAPKIIRSACRFPLAAVWVAHLVAIAMVPHGSWLWPAVHAAASFLLMVSSVRLCEPFVVT